MRFFYFLSINYYTFGMNKNVFIYEDDKMYLRICECLSYIKPFLFLDITK